MTMKKEKQTVKAAKLSRRNFFKLTTGAGVAAALVGTGLAKAAVEPQGKESFSLFRKEYNSIDDIYEIASQRVCYHVRAE